MIAIVISVISSVVDNTAVNEPYSHLLFWLRFSCIVATKGDGNMADCVTVQVNPHQNTCPVQKTNEDGIAVDTANSFYGLSLRTTLLKLRKGSRLLSSDAVFQLKMPFSNRKQTLSEDINDCRRCFGVCHTRMRNNTIRRDIDAV